MSLIKIILKFIKMKLFFLFIILLFRIYLAYDFEYDNGVIVGNDDVYDLLTSNEKLFSYSRLYIFLFLDMFL